MSRRLWIGGVLGLLALLFGASVWAQVRPTPLNPGVVEWLTAVHEASRRRVYSGTFVVWAGGNMASARLWHVCEGEQQLERVQTLTGVPRSTFRRNDQVVTFFPETRLALAEKRQSLGLFPDFLQSVDSSIAQFYKVRAVGKERVAGFEADVVELYPADRWRFGYRVWTEQKTGLVVKLQTLNDARQILEQAAFSELQLDPPLDIRQLSQMMDDTAGYRVKTPRMEKTDAAAQGWRVSAVVPGFKPTHCYRRTLEAAAPGAVRDSTLQCIFSDGLASVSLFVNVFDPQRHAQPDQQAMGATHTLTQRKGDWWLTAVGEVPAQTLAAFVQGLERQK